MFPSPLLIMVRPYEQFHSINQSNNWTKDELEHQHIIKIHQNNKTASDLVLCLANFSPSLGNSWQNPEFGWKAVGPPGGTCMLARRFLGRTPELFRNSTTKQEFMQLRSSQGTIQWLRLKTHIKELPLLGIRFKFEFLCVSLIRKLPGLWSLSNDGFSFSLPLCNPPQFTIILRPTSPLGN